MSIDPSSLPSTAAHMADEGIPIAAIARILSVPFSAVHNILQDELLQGHITEMPRPDWPPGVRINEHLPTTPVTRKTSSGEIEIVCRKLFKLTNLEAGFIVLLLKSEHTTKKKLHHVIETQRLQRASRPDTMEMTDEKMVDVMICKLRKKLKAVDEDFLITTVWGGGYYIEVSVKEKLYARLAAEGVSSPYAAPAVHAGAGGSAGDKRECLADQVTQPRPVCAHGGARPAGAA